MNENPLVIDLTDEKGEKVKVEIVQQFFDNNKHYPLYFEIIEYETFLAI